MKMCGAFKHLGPRERKREEDGIPRRHVGHRDAFAHFDRGSTLRHVDRAGKRRPAERVQPDLRHQMPFRAECLRHARRRVEFDLVPLPVVEREGVARVALAPRQRQAGGGIQASAQQAYRFIHYVSSVALPQGYAGNSYREIPLPHFHAAGHHARQRDLCGHLGAGRRAAGTRAHGRFRISHAPLSGLHRGKALV